MRKSNRTRCGGLEDSRGYKLAAGGQCQEMSFIWGNLKPTQLKVLEQRVYKYGIQRLG